MKFSFFLKNYHKIYIFFYSNRYYNTDYIFFIQKKVKICFTLQKINGVKIIREDHKRKEKPFKP